MKKNFPFKFMLALSIVAMLNLTSCKKYDDGPGLSLRSKKARLTGEWEVKSVENSFGDFGDVTLEFEKDGEMKWSYSYDGYSYTYEGDWEFSSDKEDVEISLDVTNETIDWKINRLTNKEFWFDDEDGDEWKLEAK